MKIRTLLLLIGLGAIAIFTALNWHLIIAPSTLSLGLIDVNAPLGLVMLGLVTFLTCIFLAFVAYLQTLALFEARRHAQELVANRELVAKVETSRLFELRRFLEEELKRLIALDAESRAEVLARLERLESDLRLAGEQAGNTIAAYIGEVEDRLERGFRGIPGQLPV